jgi:hypothetical protein
MTLGRDEFAVVICIILISIIPAMANAIYALGGTSSTAQSGGGQIAGSWSQVCFSNSIPDQSDLLAEIWSEVRVPSGQKGSAHMGWTVPKSSLSTITISSASPNYQLSVSAYGDVSASVEKTSDFGDTMARGYIMSDAYTDLNGSSGCAEINSEVFMTGIGAASASAKGSASYSVTRGEPMVPVDLKTSGSVEGKTSIDAESTFEGTISRQIGSLNPAFARLCVDSSVGSSSVSSSAHDSIHLAAGKNITFAESGISKVDASAFGSQKGISMIIGKGSTSPASYASAASSANMSASAQAYYESDEAAIESDLMLGANFVGSGGSAPGINVHSALDLYSSARRGANSSEGIEPTMATANIIAAKWDASASRSARPDTWSAYLSGATTGFSMDGSDMPTELGFAAGAKALGENREISSKVAAYQDAGIYDGNAYTSSYIGLNLIGPAYDDAGRIDDAAGARFALKSGRMGASNGGTEIGDVLNTRTAGPGAFLWITGASEQLINGHYYSENINSYEVIFDPAGSGEALGPKILEGDPIPRTLSLVYRTSQPVSVWIPDS